MTTKTFSKNGHKPATIPIKLQPHDAEAEEALLGSLLIDNDAVVKVAPLVQARDFFIERYGWIYAAILSLWQKGCPADTITLTDTLEAQGKLAEIGGSATLTDLIMRCPTSIHAVYYAGIVTRLATLRRLIEAAGDISRLAFDAGEADVGEVVDRAEEIIFGVSADLNRTGPGHIAHAISRHQDRMDYLYQHGGGLAGMSTGFSDLDKLLGGLQRSDMVVLAGRPGMGKTSLALNVALTAAKKYQKRVAIFSLEMSEQQLLDRFISAEAGINSQKLRTGELGQDEWKGYTMASEVLSSLPLYIDDTPAISAFELRTKARRLHAEHGLDLLILDYLQLMRGDFRSENRQQEISLISRSVKALARELNIPILALSQLSRGVESRTDKRPILADLRESGAIEQDADVVMFVYRDDVYNPETKLPNVAEIIIGKHRSGPTGTVQLYFKRHLAQFVTLTTKTMDY